jgi:hypothetical protein
MTTDDRLETITDIMCDAIDRAEAWYCEILAQRCSGMHVTARAYDQLAELDRHALRTVEAYCRMTEEAMAT